jgi:hypothetical protein
MSRSLLLLPLLAGCVADAPDITAHESAVSASFTRERVAGDIYHYELVLPLGAEPNAAIRVHRVVRETAPFVPARTHSAAMLLHGDFSTFVTNFVPGLGDPASPVSGLAPYLASAGIDVWGVDRRWTLPPTGGDVSDFAGMGVAQELDDIGRALAFARVTRTTQGEPGKLALIGFSHGAQLAYAYAAVESGKPPAQRHVDALVPIDYYGDFAPANEDVRTLTCEFSAQEYQLVADGVTAPDNGFIIDIGAGALATPDALSPLGVSYRDAMLQFAGTTYVFAAFAPLYHLAAPILEANQPIGLRESSETAIATWFAGATAYQAMLEAADLDALLCGEGPQPVDAPLSRIRVPLFYLGAAGGIGVEGLHATTSVSSTDVTTLMVQRFGADRRAEEFGHADLLFAADAATLAWQPLATWLLHH